MKIIYQDNKNIVYQKSILFYINTAIHKFKIFFLKIVLKIIQKIHIKSVTFKLGWI